MEIESFIQIESTDVRDWHSQDRRRSQLDRGKVVVLPPAMAAAVFDATGVYPHGLPLPPAYLTTLLKA
jgi:hypothetical protein